MNITIEQARTLRAVAEEGSISKAASSLRKRHSAILYSIRTLEKTVGLRLIDNSGYRSRLTLEGQRFLVECRRLLDAERDLQRFCSEMSSGWEPGVCLVHEGVVPLRDLAGAIQLLGQAGAPTRLRLVTAYHQEVETAFLEQKADILITLLPLKTSGMQRAPLTPLLSHLVASESHPLSESRRRRTLAELRSHRFITVRGSSAGLNLPTSGLDSTSHLQVGNFETKREFLLAGLGFGWMPEHLIAEDLAAGRLRSVAWTGDSTHTFFPYVHYRQDEHLGRATRFLIDEFLKRQQVPPCSTCTLKSQRPGSDA